MRNGARLTKFAAVFIAVIEPLSLTANEQSPSPANCSAKAFDSMLPRKVVVPISTVNRFFPEVTREASTGHNLTAVGNAKATRSVIYANSDGSKKVTMSVDQYSTASDASSAYQEAVTKSKTVPGFRPVPAENLGQERLCRNRDSGRRDAHRPWSATRHAGRGSNPGRVRSHAGEHSQAHLPNPRGRTHCQSRYGSKPTEIVAAASNIFPISFVISLFPFAQNEITRLS